MDTSSSRLTELLNTLTELTAELVDLSRSSDISSGEQSMIRDAVLCLDALLQPAEVTGGTNVRVTQLPVFTTDELISTIQSAQTNEDALRHVMLTTDIPIHWNTIFPRVFAIIRDSLRPHDELPQTGHPGMTRWQYRLSWQMQQLRSEGVVRSAGGGYWIRTDPNAPNHQPALFDE
ncbi:MAG: hypothetical protein RLZZ78_41 [Armatimonadota bacterium]